jgi:hypothetical protein
MPRKKPLTKCDSCDATVRVSRLSSHKIHRCTNRPYTCQYCNMTVPHREYLQNHDVSCDKCPTFCRYCHECVLNDQLVSHTAGCDTIENLIEKYREISYDNVLDMINLMSVLQNLTKNARVKFGHRGYKMQLNHMINKGRGLEALICAKQFGYSWLYNYIIYFNFGRTPPKYCLLDDMEFILGENITHEYVSTLLKYAGYTTTTEWIGYFIYTRLFCQEKSYSVDFVKQHYFSQYNKSKKEMKNNILLHLTADTSGIIMHYVFSDKIIIEKDWVPSSCYLSPC